MTGNVSLHREQERVALPFALASKGCSDSWQAGQRTVSRISFRDRDIDSMWVIQNVFVQARITFRTHSAQIESPYRDIAPLGSVTGESSNCIPGNAPERRDIAERRFDL